MERSLDVLHVGLMCTDMPIRIPYDVLDFTIDSTKLERVEILPGGDATNASQVMALLGKRTALAAKIGNDDFGRIITRVVASNGADTSQVKLVDGERTSLSIVMINRKGDRSFLFLPGTILDFSFEDLDPEALKKARHVNFGSYFALPGFDRGGAEQMFKAAKAAGATTSADATFDTYGSGCAGVLKSLRYVDYFLPSYIEGKYLTGESEPERIADALIRETGDKTVVIKMADEGCFVKSQGKVFYSPPFDVNAVDTTGAGDNFVSGFLIGILNGWDVEQCAEFGNAVAGFSVQYVGAVTREMSMARVEEFIRSTPRKSI